MHGSSASQTVLFLQASSPLQTQKSVHGMVCDLHPHLWVEHGVLLSHPHLITLIRSSGAKEVARGTIVGVILVLPSLYDQPWSVGSSNGGWVCRTFRHTAS